MKIYFENHKVSDSPLSVLRHLYYYTKQYGLSVKQFTGQHWRYWEKLPDRLEVALGDEHKTKAIINELHKLAAESEKRQQRRRKQMNRGWAEKEVVINAQLISLLCALPPQIISAGFAKLTGEKSESNFRVVKLKIPKEDVKKQDYDFVEPDLLFLNDDNLAMIEIKTRGGSSSNYSYPPRQLLNYLRLAYECDKSKDPMPSSFSHIVLVPTVDRQWFYSAEKWIINLQDGQNKKMTIDFDTCFKLSKYSKEKYYEDFKRLMAKFPIYVRSWSDFANAFNYAADEYPNGQMKPHIKAITAELSELSDKSTKFI